ncbi:30S ribosomal protein S3 [Mannheimia haemolytica]|uniref:Small ribosomal subunit protein uS3 n=1 Tax=Mannheimia haemolytica TaxID=75985 RepID=A0A378N0S0_MANHA|nr:30S ribosomal protein S3 [Mannheimia haemolytica]
MGQKVHPNGIRLGIVKPWNSTWFANTQDFADNLDGDFKVRKFLNKELANASVSRITIERPAKSIRVTIHTARRVSLSVKKVKMLKNYATQLRKSLAFQLKSTSLK